MYKNKKGKKEVDTPPSTYQDRYIQLKLLGFKEYSLYLESIYWKIIIDQVMRRDNYLCTSGYRCKGNKSREIQVHHVNYARSVMLGVNLGPLITLCRDCHEYCEVSKTGAKYSLYESQQRTFKLLTGSRKNPSVNNPAIGKWYKRQYLTSRFYSQNVLKAYQDKELPWYQRVLEEIVNGEIPANFATYLDLPKEVLQGGKRYAPTAGRLEWSKYLAEERRIKRGVDEAARRAKADLPGFTKRLQRKKFWRE